MKRIFLILLGGMLFGTLSTHAANIHLRYFESIDVFLTEERFQSYSFSALADENVTIIAYGLENETVPALTVFDTIGSTLIENPNLESVPAAAVQFTVPENGIYTFLVSRQTDSGGLIRVMVFEGDPLTDDRTLIDTVDPLLPARAFLFAGDETDPVEVQISVVTDDDTTIKPPEVFASRGTDVDLPPLAERTEPVTSRAWENTDSERIYTINVRAIPEPVAHVNGFFSRTQQTSGIAQLQVDVNEGGPPEEVNRPVCRAFVLANGSSFTGPSEEDYEVFSDLTRGQEVEIVGENGDFFLIVDPNSPTGGSWIRKDALDIPGGLESEDCSRVEEVAAPPIEPANNETDTGNPPSNNTSTQTGQTGGNPGENWCYDPAKWGDGRCNTGSPDQNNWYWTCGFYMANFDRDQNRANVPADCVSVLPPVIPVPNNPINAGTLTGNWSGCFFGEVAYEAWVNYGGAPAGTSFVELATNYGTFYASPNDGFVYVDTGEPYFASPFVVTGTLTARTAENVPLDVVSIGGQNCP